MNNLIAAISYYVIPYLENINDDEKLLLLITFSPIDYAYFTQAILQMLKDDRCSQDTVLTNLIL